MQYGFFRWGAAWSTGSSPIIGVMIPLSSHDYKSFDIKGPSPENHGLTLLDMNSCTHKNLKGTAYKSNLQRSEDGRYHIGNKTVDELVYLDRDGTRSLAFKSDFYSIQSKPRYLSRNYTMDITVNSGVITVTSTWSLHDARDPDKFWYSRASMGVFFIESREGNRMIYHTGSSTKDLTRTEAEAAQQPAWSVPDFVYPTLSKKSASEATIGAVIDQVTELSQSEKDKVMEAILDRTKLSIPVYSENIIFGDLSQECADQAKLLDINLSQYIYELTQMKDQVVGTLQLLKGKASVKNLSSLYLSASYGYANTYRDTKAIVDAMFKELRSYGGMYTCRAQKNLSDDSPSSTFTSWRTSFFQKIYYDQSWNDPLLDGLQTAIASSIIPSLSDVWDYIPFSFVVNWFVNISNALEAVDAKTFIATLPIRAVIETRKDFTELDLALLPELKRYNISGNAKFAYYRRTLRRSARLPYARFGESNPSNHWVEGTALLMQARR